MELFSLSLAGYRRFKNTAQLRTSGKVVALIGPNEAGKTSILDALISLNDAGAFEAGDFSRGTDSTETEVVAKFLLDEGEAAAAGLRSPSWMRIHKEHDGRLLFGFDPDAPDRDPTDRSAAIAAARALLRDAASLRAFEEAEDDLPDLLSTTIDVLASSGPDLEADVMTKVRKVEAELAALDTELLGALPAHAALAPAWTRMIETEAAPSPFQQAVKTLRPLLPKFLLFDDAARRLASSYAMSDLASETPRALQALLNVAGLNMADVMSAISRGAGDDLTTLEHKANRTLERAFREAWRQSGVSVALRLSTDLLEIQIRDEEERFTRLAERSDGLRQFVALHAFVAQAHADSPILLIDEAEQRLHYDAQADLVQMLARQRLAAKVVYTTHSAGCLPEDLGHGVRLIEPVPGHPSASRVVNKFWSRPGGGFSPLLFGLGATTMAFFPTRRAVCVEGPGNLLLLPAMLREALREDTLGYQIVPGLSSAARSLAPIVPAAAANVTFLVDGDDGGIAIGTRLVAGGVPEERVLHLKSADNHAIELEDFIDPKLLVDAINRILAKFLPDAPPFRRRDLRRKHRTKALRVRYAEAVGREIDKVELAYEILEMVDADPTVRLCDATRRDQLANIGRRIAASFT